MNSYSKPLIAMGIALCAVLMAGLWLHTRMLMAAELTEKREEMQGRISSIEGNAAMAAQFERKLGTLRDELTSVTDRFGGADYEIHQLVMAVVDAAGASGMQMVNASTLGADDNAIMLKPLGGRVSEVSHEIRLRGSYAGFVGFLQSMDDWTMGVRVKAMDIFREDPVRIVEGATIRDEIDVVLNLSVFVFEEVEDWR